MALEGLHVPAQASWYPAFRSELLTFPSGKHDDQVDALGLVGQLLDRMIKGTVARDEDAPPRGSNDMTFDEALTLAKPKTNAERY
jgi:hypothetical protein